MIRARVKKPRVRQLEWLCYWVDRSGRQHFNFAQQVWLDPGVPMGYTKGTSIALTTLAANLLVVALPRGGDRREFTLTVGLASRYALTLARQFCEDCLLAAPAGGWIIPRAAIRAWLSARLAKGSAARGVQLPTYGALTRVPTADTCSVPPSSIR